MDADTLGAFVDTARRFAAREVTEFVGLEGRDGRLDALPRLLDRAEALGLLATPDPEGPGHETGVWALPGGAGDEVSVRLLEEVAASCAGVAAAIHAAGLGAAAVGPRAGLGRTGAAFFEPEWRFDWQYLRRPPSTSTRCAEAEGRLTVRGEKCFVPLCPGTTNVALLAAGEQGWRPVLVAGDAAGLTRYEVEPRTGLAALWLQHLELRDVEATELPDLDPKVHLRRLLLGMGAVATGNAIGAVAEATDYARSRRQGGRPIAEHPAVQLLLGESAARAEASAALVREAARTAADGEGCRRAMMAKLEATTLGAAAVSDALQVLGGYGYMEDYGLEKRLRDALTLKAMMPGPDLLRRMIATPPGDAA